MPRTTRRIVLTETPRIPWDGLVLGWGAMLPFAALAGIAWGAGEPWPGLAREAARLWAGAILIFLSGVRRGLSFRTEGGPRAAQLVTFAVLFLSGAAILVLPPDWALPLGSLALAALAVADPLAARSGAAPHYFARLRPAQMGVAALAVAACWAATG
ncbi:DUF3429 family protein [Roseivivax isoporae]|uniref:DUF3429 domain-containing protein n=1 Tax=Roseivivax isoporae LMG 25204 TaxID=1449351 RepID=X7FCS4_9RHOB|nr:DUF3429 family protein [Roseivivax isoporae]ETX29901.1 hypothetical protein RISW2_19820 [Roseivivax isoporae LMG 25204]